MYMYMYTYKYMYYVTLIVLIVCYIHVCMHVLASMVLFDLRSVVMLLKLHLVIHANTPASVLYQ